MSIIVRAEAVTSAVNVAAFHEVAKRLAAAAAAEPGTVQFRWFSTEDPLRFVVIEEYSDEAAAFAHNEGCANLLPASERSSRAGRGPDPRPDRSRPRQLGEPAAAGVRLSSFS